MRKRIRLPGFLRAILRREEVELKYVATFVAGAVAATALGVGTAMHLTSSTNYPDAYSSYATGTVVDCSYSCPSAASLRSAGYRGVMSYLSYDAGKDWTAARLTDVRSHGLAAGFNWESTSSRALYGYSAGQSDARQAQAELITLGAPANTPIYFSVDFDATPAQQCAIDNYFAGVDSVIGAARTGAYADYYVLYRSVSGGCVSLAASGHARYLWQTYAWSGGARGAYQLYQYANGAWNDTIDLDAVGGTWGGWLPDGSVLTRTSTAPAPAPTPSPSPRPASCTFGSSGWSLKPWPNGDGNQVLVEYEYGGSLSCRAPQFSYGLQYVDKYSGRRYNVSWTGWTTATSHRWDLSRLVTPCSDGHRTYHFMVALRSGTGRIAAYKQVGSFAINADCG